MKTKDELTAELAAARERVGELEALEAERRRSEQVEDALYRIAETASAAEDMQQFYAAMHRIVGELMYAKNFYIALYDEERQMMNFPFFVDEVDLDVPDPNVWEDLGTGQARGITAYVLRTLLAVFGAPLALEDHADRALAAAREMLEVRLPRLNGWLGTKGVEAFQMGIGLNSGPFMSGNVGSERRLEYTVHGDTVNTASRIEGMTKATPHSILMAESTVESLAEPDGVDFVGEFEVRGRQKAIRLWTLADGEVTAPAAEAGFSARRPA